MRATEFLSEAKVTLNQLYSGDFPDRDEQFWDSVGTGDLDTPLEVRPISRFKLQIMLLSQYRTEDIHDLVALLKPEQKKIIRQYVKDPDLSNRTIVIDGYRVIDGNHRALAAVLSNRPINYVDLSELDDSEDIDESENLQEIQTLSPSEFDPQDEYEKKISVKAIAKPLPGNSGLVYTIQKKTFLTTIAIWDPKIEGTKPPGQLVGYMNLLGHSAAPVNDAIIHWPVNDGMFVNQISVSKQYQGQGIGKALYGLALTVLKKPLIAGSSQTPSGMAMWASIAKIPGVTVKGFLKISDKDVRYAVEDIVGHTLSNPVEVENPIEIIKKQIKGQYSGKKGKYNYFTYDVVPKGNALAPVVRNEMTDLYDNEFYETGLYAVWSGVTY